MNLFSKKQELVTVTIPKHSPILSNMPVGLIQKSAVSTIEKEVVEWYMISKSVVRSVNGHPFYPLSSLRRLKTLGSLTWNRDGGYDELVPRQFTSGKERLYCLHWNLHNWRSQSREEQVFDAYTINESTGDVTFFPKFFAQVLARKEMQLLKIQATEKWHQDTEEIRERTFVDPEISLEWEPEWK